MPRWTNFSGVTPRLRLGMLEGRSPGKRAERTAATTVGPIYSMQLLSELHRLALECALIVCSNCALFVCVKWLLTRDLFRFIFMLVP